MPNITVKNIPKKLYDQIKQSAAENRRSINQEIIVCLGHAMPAEKLDPTAFLARADALRERVKLPPLTDDILRKAKSDECL